jgi:NADH:ubiquinone oxidoreductase subunit H
MYNFKSNLSSNQFLFIAGPSIVLPLIKAPSVLSSALYAMVYSILATLSLIVPLLGAVAFYTLGERKFMSTIQRRKGPNITGFWGVLQPLADGLKLVLKEFFIPRWANPILFTLAPQITFFLSLVGWLVIPMSLFQVISDLQLPLLFTLVVSSLSIYGVVLAGWASNSKYAFLGGLRSVAQVISYELVIGFSVLMVVAFSGSFNFLRIVFLQYSGLFILPLLPVEFVTNSSNAVKCVWEDLALDTGYAR